MIRIYFSFLQVLQGSLRRLEATQLKEEANTAIEDVNEDIYNASDDEEDFDYVCAARVDGDDQGILPFADENQPPQLPEKLNPPQLPPKLTSAVFSAPPVPLYASVTPRSKRGEVSGISPQNFNSLSTRLPQGNAVKQFQTYGEFMKNGEILQHNFENFNLTNNKETNPNDFSKNTKFTKNAENFGQSGQIKKTPVPKPRKVVKRSSQAVPSQSTTCTVATAPAGTFTSTSTAPVITAPPQCTFSGTPTSSLPVVPEVPSAAAEAVATFHDDDMYGAKAPGKQAIIHWFNRTQSNSLKDNGTSVIPPWFHGLITRE